MDQSQPNIDFDKLDLRSDQKRKLFELIEWISLQETIAVAYSGGVDSSLLAYLVRLYQGSDSVAITAHSEIYPETETREAIRLASELGLNHYLLQTNELDNPAFVENSPIRCYHCKLGLYAKMKALAVQKGCTVMVDGQNTDDAVDFRPGAKAGKEIGIVSPFIEFDVSKTDIRDTAKALNLSVWDKPSHPCLSTRFPYGEKIEKSKLQKIEAIEEFLYFLGFKDLRVRDHGDIARIEVQESDFPVMLDAKIRRQVIDHLVLKGFKHVTMDMEGRVHGSMNRKLKK